MNTKLQHEYESFKNMVQGEFQKGNIVFMGLDITWVNNFAVAKVIRYLYNRLSEVEMQLKHHKETLDKIRTGEY